MTDTLRNRIAAVLNANLPVMEYLRPGDTEYAADAVIAELALELDDEEPPWQPTGWHRYITKWERNE